jgi:PAS domain S-box-containing protein
MNQFSSRTLDQCSPEELRAEVVALRQQLDSTHERMEELENTIEAIQGGNVDAVVVNREGNPEVWTLEQANQLHLNLSEQTANIGTWDWDIATGEVTWSESLLHSFGLTSSGPPSFEALIALIYPDDRERVQRRIAAALEKGDEFYEEFRVLRCNSDLRWVAARGRVVRGFRRKPQRLVGISLDITERRQAEDELRQADQRKDEFLAMLAHELRNPLAAISNAIRLNQSPDLPPEERQWIEQMLRRQTDQLGHLIDDLLDVARITSSKISLQKEALSLTDLAQRTLDTLRPQLLRSRHDLRLDFPAEPVWVDADPSRLEQVLVNLITNAIKYTKDQGQIWLKIAREGNEAVIAVKDTGIGIAAEMLPRIFDLFAQAEQGLDRSRGGLGIGLTLVRRIVELHGGTVTVSSPGVGMGSEFTVRLPITEPRQEESSARAVETPKLKGQRILVVDDNRDAAITLSLLLKASGHETAMAYGAQKAIELAGTFKPQIALLDIGLPGMNGLELGSLLRQSNPDIFLVAISGYGQAEDRARTKAAGFDEHFVKPVRLDDLLGVLAGRMG